MGVEQGRMTMGQSESRHERVYRALLNGERNPKHGRSLEDFAAALVEAFDRYRGDLASGRRLPPQH